MSARDDVVPAVQQPQTQTRTRTSDLGDVLAISRAEARVLGGVFWERFVRLAGGPSAVIAVVSCAATNPARTGEEYAAHCRRLGARDACWLHLWQRCDADSAEVVTLLHLASGIVLADGDHFRLLRLLAGTRALATIHRRHAEGAILAGVGAGARLLPLPIANVAHGTQQALGADRPKPVSPVAPAEANSGFGPIPDLIGYQSENPLAEWSGF